MGTTAKHIALELAMVFLATANAIAGNHETAPRLNTISIRRTMSKSSEYVDKYAEAAMEQMRKYGIPASVTLAQGILESASGQSELSRKGNNHFGIKASSTWLENGGRYLVYTDDKPNEKFCQYASVADSYEHHSLFLKGNKRYADLFQLSPDDYVGWTRGLQNDGYATSKSYAASLQAVIKSNGLDKYDQMVMKEKGWQSTVSQTATTAELAAKSQERTEDQTKTVSAQVSENPKVEEKQKPQDKDFFNTIQAFADGDDNSWSRLLGSTGGNSFADPIVEIVSTLFAGLMAMAIQIDNNGIVQQQDQTVSQGVDANALASQNFDNAMNSMNNNTIKRTRS